MWFEEISGFREEEDVDEVGRQFFVDGVYLVSKGNGRRMCCGRSDMWSLADLRGRRPGLDGAGSVREKVRDIRDQHADLGAAGRGDGSRGWTQVQQGVLLGCAGRLFGHRPSGVGTVCSPGP